MNRTILVIGSVTARQYQAVRLEALSAGFKPVIARVTLYDLYFDGDWNMLVEGYATPEEAAACRTEDVDDISAQIRELAHRHISACWGEIYAVVMDQYTWGMDWGEVMMNDVGKALEEREGIHRWIALPGGGLEYAGTIS